MSFPLPLRAVRLRLRTLALCASLLALPCPARADELHLLPVPREIKQTSESFPVSAQTRIVVARAHAAEDKVTAEMLAEVRQKWGGRFRPRG